MQSICFVAPHAWPVLSRDPDIKVVGGAEVQQCILARLFARRGHRVSMICLDYGQPQRTEVDGVSVHRIFRMDAGMPVLRFLHPRLTSMWRALGAADADIYYYRSSAMWVGVVAEFCRRNGRRSIYAGASDMDFAPDAGGQIPLARDRWLYRQGLAAVDRIVAQNEEQVRTCLANHGRHAEIIPSCYEPPRVRTEDKSDLALWVGRIHPNKRPEMLLELAKRLPQRRFVMVGGAGQGVGDYEERIRAQAAGLPNVELTGFLPLAQVEPWFDRARVLVNTSLFEGMPNTFLQAWARDIPTVGTVDVGAGVHHVAMDVASLAAQVERLADAATGGRYREYFERNHSPQEVVARYARVFDQLSGGKVGRAAEGRKAA
jgi:glycosyltransferase involved in cell wall biosynthesis